MKTYSVFFNQQTRKWDNTLDRINRTSRECFSRPCMYSYHMSAFQCLNPLKSAALKGCAKKGELATMHDCLRGGHIIAPRYDPLIFWIWGRSADFVKSKISWKTCPLTLESFVDEEFFALIFHTANRSIRCSWRGWRRRWLSSTSWEIAVLNVRSRFRRPTGGSMRVITSIWRA
jgi:hypothetical protein